MNYMLIITELKHVNIVRLHDVIHTESKLVLIFEVSRLNAVVLVNAELIGLVLRTGSQEVYGYAWRQGSTRPQHCQELYIPAIKCKLTNTRNAW